MLSTTALVSLACLISSGEADPTAIAKLTENLSQQEVAAIQEIHDRGTCLPEKFSRLVNKQIAGPGTAPMSAAPTGDYR